jgi:uncharacterized membrane protein
MQTAEFDVKDILPLALTIVVVAIGISYGNQVLDDLQGDHGTGSFAYNATKDGTDATGKFTSKLGMIVTVIVAAIVIGILVRYLMVRYR